MSIVLNYNETKQHAAASEAALNGLSINHSSSLLQTMSLELILPLQKWFKD